MTNPITPEAVERLAAQIEQTPRPDVSQRHHTTATLRALARELAEVKAERDTLSDVLEREKADHRAHIARSGGKLRAARAQIVAAQEDMKERAANVLDHHWYGYGAVARALGNRLCCDGNMCGCQGADVGSYLQYLIRALPPADPAATKEETNND